MSLENARATRDEGIARAVDHAEEECSGWGELAFRFIRLFATENRGRSFTGLQIREASIARGIIQPENAKAWGGPMQRAARVGVIKRCGTVPDPNRHCNPVPLWEVGFNVEHPA